MTITITPDARRYPFLNAVGIIDDETQDLIAADMREAVKRERRDTSQGAMSRSTKQAQEAGARSGREFRVRRAAARRQIIIDILKGREMTVREIEAEMQDRGQPHASYSALANYIDAMRSHGLVTARREVIGSNISNVWSLACEATQ